MSQSIMTVDLNTERSLTAGRTETTLAANLANLANLAKLACCVRGQRVRFVFLIPEAVWRVVLPKTTNHRVVHTVVLNPVVDSGRKSHRGTHFQGQQQRQRRLCVFFTGFIVKGPQTSRPVSRGRSSVRRCRLTSPELTWVYLLQQPLQQTGGPQRSHHHQHRVIRRRRSGGTGRRRTGTAAPLRCCCRHHGLDSPLMASSGHKQSPAHCCQRRENVLTGTWGGQSEERSAFRCCWG